MNKSIISLEQIIHQAEKSGHSLSDQHKEVFASFLKYYTQKHSTMGLNIHFDNFSNSPGSLSIQENVSYNYSASGCGISRDKYLHDIFINLKKIKNPFDLEFVLYHELGHAVGCGGVYFSNNKEVEKEFRKTHSLYLREIIVASLVVLLLSMVGVLFHWGGYLALIVYVWYIKTKIKYLGDTYSHIRYSYLREMECDKFALSKVQHQSGYNLEDTFLGDSKIAIQKESHPSGDVRINFLKYNEIGLWKVSDSLLQDRVISIYQDISNGGTRKERFKIELYLILNNLFSWINLP